MTHDSVEARLLGRMTWVLDLNSASETPAFSGKGGLAISAVTIGL